MKSVQAKPFSPCIFVLFEILLFLPLLFRPFRYRGAFFFPVIFGLYLSVITSTTGSQASDWSLGLTVTPQLFKALDVLVLSNAERELRRTGALAEDPKTYGTWKKLYWAAELVTTPRGIGWNWEVPYICYQGTATRGTYIRSRLPRIMFYYLLLDLVNHSNPSFSSAPIPTSSPFSIPTLLAVWSFAIGAYIQLWLVHTTPALLAVCLDLGAPSSFPYVMGPIGFMNSLRCLWGRTWHQFARRQMHTLGVWLRRKMSVAPGSWCSAYIQLCVGFAVGGVTHVLAGWMTGKHSGWHDPTNAAKFFLLQLFGVVLEDAVVEVLLGVRVVRRDWRRNHMRGGKKRFGKDEGWWRLSDWPSAFGYVWTVCWLSVTLPPYVEGLRQLGILEPHQLPFSPVDWAIKLRASRM